MSIASASVARRAARVQPVTDNYAIPVAAGSVNGTTSPTGVSRIVTDVEGKILVRDGKAYLPVATTSGWQRQSLMYGPYTRAAGLAAAFKVKFGDVQGLNTDTNDLYGIGWFTSSNPSSPSTDEHVVLVRANGGHGGAVYLSASAASYNVLATLRQIEATIIVVLRATGAVYYMVTASGATTIPDYPAMTPIGIDATRTDASLYAGVTQRLNGYSLGLDAVNVTSIAAAANWYGLATAADTLIAGSTQAISGRSAAIGGSWTTQAGTPQVSTSGLTASASSYNVATLAQTAPVGLAAMTITTGATAGDMWIVFRFQDINNYFWARVNGSKIQLTKTIAGVQTTLNTSGAYLLHTNTTQHLAILDDGTNISMILDGVVAATASDTALASATGVGVNAYNAQNTTVATNFEAHPRSVSIPSALRLGAPYERVGTTTLLADTFAGSATSDMAGRSVTGTGTWSKLFGSAFPLDGAGNISFSSGVSGDSIYTVPWTGGQFADLSASITPPGSSYGTANTTTIDNHAGVVFVQDANNYIGARLYVSNYQINAAEIEVFACVSGSGAVITRVNFGTAIGPGITTALRATFDGTNFICWRGTELAHMFSLRDVNATYGPMTINAVGLHQGTYGWGTMTNFSAKA